MRRIGYDSPVNSSLRATAPVVTRLEGRFGFALSVDVEEWYHTCLVPSYVQPERRPPLVAELDRLLPKLLDLFAEADCHATFFVLGEVAERLPGRIREIARAGHEVGSHGFHHLRACARPPEVFGRDIRRCKALLEDLLGEPIAGFRAPEWSLRDYRRPQVREVAAAGFLYDSSLAPYSLSGSRRNPLFASRLEWLASLAGDFRGEILELPPLTFGGGWRIPAGSWTGRLVAPERLAAAAHRHHAAGGLPVAVIHPWEVSEQPTPGPLSGLARFIHETGRLCYLPCLRRLLAAAPWRSLATAAGLGSLASTAPASSWAEPATLSRRQAASGV
jgi:peptidoglycan/xylan/chitin deacetylase (PgdA/CDA1 family)